MQTTFRVTRCALTAFAVIWLLCAPAARGGVLDGITTIGAGGMDQDDYAVAGMLQNQRGLNFGGAGYPYVVGHVGANTFNMLNPNDQIDQVVNQVQLGNVTLALFGIGDNDWISVASDVATGALSGAALASFENAVVSNIISGVSQVQAAGGAVVLGGFSNITDSPVAAAIYANPTLRANLENALDETDGLLRDYAVAHNIPFIDFFALEKQVYDSGSFVVGGVNIVLGGSDPDPHYFFQDDYHAGIVIRGEITNLFIQAINEGYGTGIPLLSDYEILQIAGIDVGQEYQQETFAPATNFGSFVTVPEPSSLTLAALGVAAAALIRNRRRGRP